MELKVIKKLNSTDTVEFNFVAEDLKAVVLLATPVLELDPNCGKCKSTELSIHTRVVKDGEFQYMEFFCKKCGARRSFGEYKHPKGAYFLKREWEDAYKKTEAVA
jgi:hypothetical protein